jgi:nicotinate-nucleotide adenylyltransferase
MAQDALEMFALDEVRFIPCAYPAHKPLDTLADAVHRVRMLALALEDNPTFSCSLIELNRKGVSFAIDTVRDLIRQEPDAVWYWIIGADTLADLASWKDIASLLPLCHFVTIARPGFDAQHVPLELPAPWPDYLRKQIRTGHSVAISSSDIRDRIQRGLSIRYLAPDAVCRYIAEQGLYINQEKP